MDKKKLLQTIKEGMKGEINSINLYQNAFDNAESIGVKDFFQDRIEEEKRHYNYLLQYFREISENKDLTDIDILSRSDKESLSPIITEEFLKRIAEKQILFSSLSTAALLEKSAMEFYKKCADETELPEMVKFFNKMFEWETRHYDDVLKLQQEAEIDFWTENRFQPF